MASLTGPVKPRYVEVAPEYQQIEVQNAEVVYIGGYYGIPVASGRLAELTDIAGAKPYGILVAGGEGTFTTSGGNDNTGSFTGNTSASPPPSVLVDVGEKILEDVPVATASAITDVGKKVYLTGDNVLTDLTLVATTFIPAVGEIAEFISSTRFHVRLYSRAQMSQN